ncbi:MAG: hypothetical protein KUL75_06605 [Sterolibacterium sp.]|nr:hypothetical protein [Sterolibacterium sp.]
MAREIIFIQTDVEKQPASQTLGAGIDADIFEADSLALGGERFWEAFWKTQHKYGGVHEGQSLAVILANLFQDAFDKLQTDIERLQRDHVQMDEAERDDIFGMVMFLLSIEQGDLMYNPLEDADYASLMARFSAVVAAEAQKRSA